MQITAMVRSSARGQEVSVRTGDTMQSISIPAKAQGRGSAVNGGEFLMLALATCYCNDLYREAGRLGIPIDGAEVEAMSEFAGVGIAAANISYRVKVHSPASAEDIQRLVQETDAVAEVHNTIRAGVPVRLLEAKGSMP
jgi:organic hydroperoxide reductase OsmC/OhrA